MTKENLFNCPFRRVSEGPWRDTVPQWVKNQSRRPFSCVLERQGRNHEQSFSLKESLVQAGFDINNILSECLLRNSLHSWRVRMDEKHWAPRRILETRHNFFLPWETAVTCKPEATHRCTLQKGTLSSLSDIPTSLKALCCVWSAT